MVQDISSGKGHGSAFYGTNCLSGKHLFYTIQSQTKVRNSITIPSFLLRY